MILFACGRQGFRPGGAGWDYRVAGRRLVVDRRVRELDPFFAGSCPVPDGCCRGTFAGSECVPQASFSTVGPIAGADRQVLSESLASGYRISVSGLGRFFVSARGSQIAVLEQDSTAGANLLAVAVSGLGLILALALQDTWCLHASAVACGRGAVLFVGDSGFGKSTLAAYLAGSDSSRWSLLSDDVLPICADSDEFACLPDFPQLKLPPAGQPALTQPHPIAPAAIYVLGAPSSASGPAIVPLTRRSATLALVRHTVATRIFDRELLERHLSFCAHVAQRVPIKLLAYPHERSLLPRVRDLLEADGLGIQ